MNILIFAVGIRNLASQPVDVTNPKVFLVRKWECIVCGFIYDEAQGLPDEGIAPGTRWEDIPDDWVCPDCGVSKEDFELLED
jgi:rubredoxin